MVVNIWEDNVNALKKENIEFTLAQGKMQILHLIKR